MGTYKINIGDGQQYLKWDGANLIVKGNVTITGGSGIANLIDAGALATLDDIAYAAITGAKPPVDADKTANVVSNLAYYNMVSAALLDSSIIIGGYIKTSLLTANNIRTGTLRSVRFRVGGGTNEDIYFEDSGIRMYDMGGQVINLYKSGLKYLRLVLGGTYGQIATDGKLSLTGNNIEILSAAKAFMFYTTGTFKFPSVWSSPSGAQGMMTYNDANDRFVGYIGGPHNKWGHWLLSSGW